MLVLQDILQGFSFFWVCFCCFFFIYHTCLPTLITVLVTLCVFGVLILVYVTEPLWVKQGYGSHICLCILMIRSVHWCWSGSGSSLCPGKFGAVLEISPLYKILCPYILDIHNGMKLLASLSWCMGHNGLPGITVLADITWWKCSKPQPAQGSPHVLRGGGLGTQQVGWNIGFHEQKAFWMRGSHGEGHSSLLYGLHLSNSIHRGLWFYSGRARKVPKGWCHLGTWGGRTEWNPILLRNIRQDRTMNGRRTRSYYLELLKTEPVLTFSDCQGNFLRLSGVR